MNKPARRAATPLATVTVLVLVACGTREPAPEWSSVWAAAAQHPATQHAQAATTSFRAAGDHAAEPTATPFTETSRSWHYLTGIDAIGCSPTRPCSGTVPASASVATSSNSPASTP